jgi:hypothetical protein
MTERSVFTKTVYQVWFDSSDAWTHKYGLPTQNYAEAVATMKSCSQDHPNSRRIIIYAKTEGERETFYTHEQIAAMK